MLLRTHCSLTSHTHTAEIFVILKYIIITLKREKNVKKMYLILKVITSMLELFGF